MAKLGLVTLLALTLSIAGCGSSRMGPTNINGNWTATLTNADGTVAYRFSATFTQGSDDNVAITNLTFTTAGACLFSGVDPAEGSFISTNGTFAMSATQLQVGGPVLALQGTASNGVISGRWSASGLVPPCSGSGAFTIQPVAA